MSSTPKVIENQQFKIKEETLLSPHVKLLNKCKDLSIFIKEYFINKNNLSNNNLLEKSHSEHQEIFNINDDKTYKDLLNNTIFLSDLNKLFNSLYSIIECLESYSKKNIEEEKIDILFNLNIQLNKYLNNIPKEKDKKRYFLISSNSDFLNDNNIVDQINKFFSLNEKEDQESKETIIVHKDNNFDNLSEIGEKESAKESIFEEEKELIEHFKEEEKEKEKIKKKEDENRINDYLSFLNHKLKRNENIIELNENNN